MQCVLCTKTDYVNVLVLPIQCIIKESQRNLGENWIQKFLTAKLNSTEFLPELGIFPSNYFQIGRDAEYAVLLDIRTKSALCSDFLAVHLSMCF